MLELNNKKTHSKKLKKILENKIVWFSSQDDVKWITGFESSRMDLFYINKKWFALTDNRYYEAAKKNIDKFVKILLIEDKSFYNIIIPLIKKQNSSIKIDENNFSIGKFNHLKKILNEFSIKIEPISFEGIRSIKNDKEIIETKKAIEITDNIFNRIVDKFDEFKSEKDVHKFIELEIIKNNCKKAFEPIVAAGINGANPHHKSSNYKFKIGDFITIDFGVHIHNGMCSDMTRTVIYKKNIDNEKNKVYEIIIEAINKALNSIKIGRFFSEIDYASRNHIDKKGYGKYFNHALGHGIGINVHEDPKINPLSQDVIEENMIITIEPGIYIPNKFGIRLEQDVLITKNGYDILNKSTLDKIIVGR